MAILASICVLTTSCAKISLSGQKKQPDQPGQQQPGAQQPGQQPGQQAGQPALTGYWNLAFQFKDKTLKSSIQLTQNGNTFTGSGTDDHNNAPFTIEQGTITNNTQVSFYKKYGNANAIQYNGTLSQVNEGDYHGPYMQGEYVTTIKGEIVQNQWEAEMQPQTANQPPQGGPDPAQQPEQPAQTGQPSPPEQPANIDPNRAPHLSGKWNVGYEYNFKTIHSVMYLEQDGGSIRGHGYDVNTKEKFAIPRGWYRFPKVTLIRKYTKGKGAVADREIAFKAQVSMVSDAEYSGPYLNGKTQGGGNWEGQLFK